ncbi:MAG: UbiA family prenyltransferase [Planctomycetota bacterium]
MSTHHESIFEDDLPNGHGAGDVVDGTGRGLFRSLMKLARPKQWTKSAFVLFGPVYGLQACQEEGRDLVVVGVGAFLAAAAFALVSSGSYVLNDIGDAEADRNHPRKRNRPIASGDVEIGTARAFALLLFGAAALLTAFIPEPGGTNGVSMRLLVAATLAIYVLNVIAYSAFLKHRVIADVMSLSSGFVLRVMAGCAAVAIVPSTWLLNVTLFLAMFLAFGKRLGERRTAAETGQLERMLKHRRVQERYTDELLRMAVVVTGVATLLTYAFYIQQQEQYILGFNLLWLTLLPATYGLLRAIVLVEHGKYDDPTELAIHDRPFQVACLAFVLMTLGLLYWQFTGAIIPPVSLDP